MKTKHEVGVFLQSECKKILDNCKNLKMVEKNTGITERTIRRYASGESDLDPQVKTAFRILSYTHTPGQAALFLKEAYPTWWTSEGQFITDDLQNLIEDNFEVFTPVMEAIFSRAHTSLGVDDKWILENFGKLIGMPAKDKLIEANLIKKSDSKYQLAKKNYRINDDRALFSLIRAQCENFPVEDLGKNALVWSICEMLPKEGIEEIKKLSVQHVKEKNMVLDKWINSNSPKTVLLKMTTFGDWKTSEGEEK